MDEDIGDCANILGYQLTGPVAVGRMVSGSHSASKRR